jgi:tetratricopeptide (TPR) repeat protein
MKKILLTMLSVALIATTASAQVATVDVAKLKSALTKADADVADAKKGAKAATWIKRGEAYLDAEAAVVNGVYAGMPENMLAISFGEVAPVQEEVGGQTMTYYPFEHFKAYIANGVVDYFIPTTVVDPQALDKAYDSFAKAYELDSENNKAGEDMQRVYLRSFEAGGAFYSISDFTNAATNFRRAFKASSHPSSPAVDTLSTFYAGMSAALGGDYENALVDLDKALAMGYEGDGEVYRMKFLSLYQLGRKEESLAVIQEGVAKYPTNEDLIDMMLRYYAENDGDASAMIPLVQDAIDKNPNNPNLYQGLAQIYDKLERIDDAVATIKKAVGVAPDNFLANYYEGLYLLKKGDKMNVYLGQQNITSAAQYQEALGAVTDVFRTALAPLEKAFALDPSEPSTVELLKNLTFRLREEEGMQAKYDKYNDLFNSMDVPQE